RVIGWTRRRMGVRRPASPSAGARGAMSRSGKRAAQRAVEVAPSSGPALRRHWWWIKPVRRVALIVLLGLIGVHGWWAWCSERALDEQIRAYATAGEVIYPGQLNDERAVGDGENAVIELR